MSENGDSAHLQESPPLQFRFTTHRTRSFCHAKRMHSSHLSHIFTFCLLNPLHKLKSMQNIHRFEKKAFYFLFPPRAGFPDDSFTHPRDETDLSVFCMQSLSFWSSFYLGSDLVAALSGLQVHDFAHLCSVEERRRKEKERRRREDEESAQQHAPRRPME